MVKALSEEEKERRKEERKQKKYKEIHKLIDGKDHKICRNCKEWLPSKEHFYKKNNFDGFDTNCKKCTSIKAGKWAKENRESKLASDRKYQAKPERRKYTKEKMKEYVNEGRYKKWQQNNKDKIKNYNKQREMNKKHDISKKEWEKCKEYFNYKCAYCNLPIEEHFNVFRGELRLTDFHKEHVDYHGSNDLSNCVPSCKKCNSSKHTSKLEDWYNSGSKIYSKRRLNKICKWLNGDYKKYIKQ